jgi:aminopeptidase N
MRAVAEEALERVTLDFTGPPVTAVRVNGEDVPYARSRGKLVAEASVAASRRFALDVEYAGTPDPVSGAEPRGWVSAPGVLRTLSVLPGDTASWVPLNDTPLDPARYTLRITVPRPFVATASGKLVHTDDSAQGSTSVWRVDLPVSEVALAVGRFRISKLAGPRGLPIEIAVPPADSATRSSFDRVGDMLSFLEARLGPFPFENLGLTVVDDYAGVDSTPARVNLSETQEVVLVHELAHQWLGGSVGTSSSRDAWLREGLPTFVEAWWTERRYGEMAGSQMIDDFRRQLGPSTRPPLQVDDPVDRWDDVTYLRGALTMDALRLEVGERQFVRSLKTFLREHRGTSASTKDFVATVEGVTDRSLDRFFSGWLSHERVPKPASR